MKWEQRLTPFSPLVQLSKSWQSKRNCKPADKQYGRPVSSSTCKWCPPPPPHHTLSILQGAGSQTEPPVGLPQLLLVSGLNETEHHSRQRHASSSRPCPHTPVFRNVGHLAAHGADEVGADLPLLLAHLEKEGRGHRVSSILYCKDLLTNMEISVESHISPGTVMHLIVCFFLPPVDVSLVSLPSSTVK